ncbi:MAG: hypothetical protein GX033_10265 [Firmicutes bacterium]|nr:hypothetical protein [Bacillota bacterium]
MFRERVGVVILEGGQPTDLVEHQMVSVRRGMTLDAIAKLRHIPEIDVIYLSTNYPELAAAATELGAVVVPEEPPFHFGRCLQYVINQGNLDGVIYMGGASCPFLTADEFRQIARDLRRYKNVVYTNNPQSADIVAFTPAKAINMIDLPDNDNVLPTRLRQGAGLERVFLPHSVGVHFDIDTPSDVLVMSLSPRVEQYTRQAIAALNWDNSRLRQAMNHLALPESNIFLAGRVNPWTMQHIGMYYRSRLRVISEERGMRATGRAERGEVHSLLAFMMEQLSPQGLIDYISSIADAAFIDTRIIFSHYRLNLTEGQRFASDLGWLDSIHQPLVEELTAAAFNAPIPIILGGHSLVAGSMWALVDTLRFADGQVQLPATYNSYAIEPDHPWVGQALQELRWNGELKGEVVGVQRGDQWWEAPLPVSTLLLPGDRLYIRM